MLTTDRVRELFTYDQETGLFTRRVTAGAQPAGLVVRQVNDQGYVHMKVDGAKFRAHRLAFLWMGLPIPEFVDHIDRNRSNNRWTNLRPATRQLNATNRSRHRNNRTGCTGVLWHKKQKKWVSKIGVHGQKIWLGSFSDKTNAVQAYLTAKAKYHADAGGKVVVVIDAQAQDQASLG